MGFYGGALRRGRVLGCVCVCSFVCWLVSWLVLFFVLRWWGGLGVFGPGFTGSFFFFFFVRWGLVYVFDMVGGGSRL